MSLEFMLRNVVWRIANTTIIYLAVHFFFSFFHFLRVWVLLSVSLIFHGRKVFAAGVSLRVSYFLILCPQLTLGVCFFFSKFWHHRFHIFQVFRVLCFCMLSFLITQKEFTVMHRAVHFFFMVVLTGFRKDILIFDKFIRTKLLVLLRV